MKRVTVASAAVLVHAAGFVLLLLVSGFANLATAEATRATGPARPDDPHLTKHHAVATAGSRSFEGTSSTSILAASRNALQLCNAAKPEGAPCEITNLTGHNALTGQAIRTLNGSERWALPMWRFEHKQCTLYLLGSIHMSKPSLLPLPEPIEAAFERSTDLVLEVDPTSLGRAEMLDIATAMQLPPGTTISSLLPAEVVSEFWAALAPYEMSILTSNRLLPVIVATQLSLARITALGFDQASGFEAYFTSRVRDRPIHQLETAAAQIRALTGSPLQDQIAMLRATVDDLQQMDQLLADMLTTWWTGRLENFAALFAEQSAGSQEFAAFMDKLLVQRNIGMANGLQALLTDTSTQSQRVYFAMVGAAHLAGPDNVIAHLEKADLRGTRIWSDQEP